MKLFLHPAARCGQKLLFVTLFSLCLHLAAMAQTVRYVKPGGTGTVDGSSWSNASADLQERRHIHIRLPGGGRQGFPRFQRNARRRLYLLF
ncbi:MAG: hypothetical protein LBI89_01240 [Prevotellaceae bacterium]|jgi:hypothetical protein|nr:hypothetical protein [Prevotellaceae bacterium]